MTTTTQNQDVTELLQEIFATPSNQVISDRFASSSEAASCSGRCGTGVCRAVV